MSNELAAQVDAQNLETETRKVAQDLINSQSVDEVKDLTRLFNLVQVKKNALRMMKMSELFDAVTDQMSERFEKRPDEFSNTELANYLNVIQNSMDKVSKGLGMVEEVPPIALTQNNVTVNMADTLSKESRNRIAEAVRLMMEKRAQEAEVVAVEEEADEDTLDSDETNRQPEAYGYDECQASNSTESGGLQGDDND